AEWAELLGENGHQVPPAILVAAEAAVEQDAAVLLFAALFLVGFVLIPVAITKMVCDLLHIRSGTWRVIVFVTVALLNWCLWQAPEQTTRAAPPSPALVR